MKIETIEIFGFASAFRALRLPFNGTHKSDSLMNVGIEIKNQSIHYGGYFRYGLKDLKLIQSLVKNGDEHAKVVRGIIVSASIIAPRYWWQECDTYRIGHERLSSQSTMHIEAKGLTGEELQKLKSEIKEGLEQERIDEFSYQTLRRIYFQRKSHRLPEWHQFCKWIEELPLAKELITIGEYNDN